MVEQKGFQIRSQEKKDSIPEELLTHTMLVDTSFYGPKFPAQGLSF